MLIIWLQGIWLPLHGVSFENTPFWAAIYMLPLTVAFLLSGPLSGYLSDKYGARLFSTGGMIITAAGFMGLMVLPADFNYLVFGIWLFILGIGMGLFSAPNTTAIMNAVPPEARGVASGMRATFQNTASTLSIGLIFSMVTAGIAKNMPQVFYTQLTKVGIPAAIATHISHLPPTAALFAAFLGYNPMQTLLPTAILPTLSAQTKTTVFANAFFPSILSKPFMDGVIIAFSISAGISLLAAVASILRGKKFVHEQEYGEKLE